MKIAALLVALAVLAPTAASAECAWVLWAQTTQNFRSEWSIHSASGNEEGCRTRLREIIKIARETPKIFSVVGDLVIVLGQDGKPLMTTDHTCLPDTVDPRGPKGGPR